MLEVWWQWAKWSQCGLKKELVGGADGEFGQTVMVKRAK